MIGKNVKFYRREDSPRQVAKRCKVSAEGIVKIENGKVENVGLKTTLEIAKGLGLEEQPWRLLEGTPFEAPSHGEMIIPADYVKLTPEQKEMLSLFNGMSHGEQMLLKSMLIGIKGAQHIAPPKKKSRG